MQIVLLKAAAHKVYITEISGTKDRLKIMIWNQAKIDGERIPILVREYKGRLKFVTGDNPYFLYAPKPNDDNVIERARKLVESMSTLI